MRAGSCGAAHASCFTMAFTLILSKAGFTPAQLDTQAVVALEQQGDAFVIPSIALTLKAAIPGIDEATFNELATLANVPWLDGEEGLVAAAGRGEFDVAVLCTPNTMHAPVGLRLLNAGVHLLIEKPMTTSYADAKSLADRARANALHAATAHMWRVDQEATWLRDQVATQVSGFAAGLRIDPESIQNLASQIDPSDPSTFNLVIESGGLITARTPEQEQALVRIETTLALIEGWADAVALSAASRLPGVNQVFELVRRRQAVGAAQKTFATLLGLELRPRLQREAMAMWQQIGTQLGNTVRDSIWKHPDHLPSAEDIKDPSALIVRLSGGDDDFDSELSKLLGS